MKKLIYTLLLSAQTLGVWAGSIKGTVHDAQGPLPACDVLIYKLSDTTQVFKNEMTDDGGAFEFDNVPQGRYLVKVEYLGYKTKTLNITLSQTKPDIKAMTIKMQDDTNMLQQVVITGQRTTLKVDADKKTFLVNADAVTEGASVSDVLNEVPSVNVDVEGNVSLRNNENVEIYINGKPSGMSDDSRGDILEQLPANSIERVEVITNPSSKYNAEGQAGIINIVLKQDQRKGYYGSVTAGANYPFNGDLGGNLGASINYVSGKWDLSASLGVQSRNDIGDRIRDRQMYRDGDTTYTRTTSDVDRKMKTGFLNLGAAYHFDKVNIISWKAMGSMADRDKYEDFKYNYGSVLNGTRIADSYATSNNYTGSQRNVLSTTLDYTHKFDGEGHEISFAGAYAYNSGNNDATYRMADQDANHVLVPGSEAIQKEDQERSMNDYTLQADYTLPINKGKMEAGLKADWRTDNNDSHTKEMFGSDSVFVPRTSLSNEFSIQQNIYAGYINYSDHINDKLKYNVGLRGELTDMYWEQHTSNEKSKRNPYFNFFPSAFLSYMASPTDELQFNYTRRVSRPQMRRLNPYINVADSSNISFGNPDLDPELTHSVEFNYVKTNDVNVYTASVYYKYTQDVVSQYSWTDNSILKVTYGNMSHSQEVGAELIAKQKIGKKVTLTGNVNIYYYDLAGGNFDINVTNDDNSIVTQQVHLKANTSLSWTGKLTADVMLPWDISAQATANYNSPKALSQGRTHHLFTSNLALKRPFFNRKVNVSLTCRDLFDSSRLKKHTYSSNFDQENSFCRSGRTILLNFSYNFGNMNVGKSKKSDKVKEDLDDMDDLSLIDWTPEYVRMIQDDDSDSGLF